ncbi:HAD-IIA family hydrolase [Algihabitans albus]|uniref:HAD-IIA family hydrolase n=1 Tax=Algihabitans albus TaxID=2164067 RepID=UPI000E5D127A|nr:HAD hydrolase-like protein [Algihabitans albus]
MFVDPRRLISADLLLADLDGCLAVNNRPLPGAADLAARRGARLHLVSNNSTDTAEGLARTLAAGGLEIAPTRIHLAGETLLRRLRRERPDARVLLAAAGDLPALAERLGILPGREDAAIVALCRDTAFDYGRLQVIAGALAGGAELWVANPDLTHPGPSKAPVPETGALLAAVRAVAPGVTPRIFGKPEPALFQAALDATGVAAEDAVMLGDNPRTDRAGAASLGIPALLIGTHPDAVAPDLASLLALASDPHGPDPEGAVA